MTLDGESFDLTADLVRARLVGQQPEAIRDYWVDIDGTRWPVKQVISVATGVSNRRRFQSQSARRWLRNLGFTMGSGSGIDSSASRPAPPRRAEAATEAARSRPSDVILVGCVKTKSDHGAAAKDLYTSDYFVKMRTFAEESGLPWFILSAEHGLVRPDEWLEPYERYLPTTSPDYRRAWGERAAVQLQEAIGSVDDKTIEIHAGSAYVDAIAPALRLLGAHVVDRLAGMSMGRRLSWYLDQDVEPTTATEVISQLRDETHARRPADVLATRGAGLTSPGMYSWWVDEEGAADLSAGLGHRIDAGLVYAGLAGATRSGGSSSSNTLWGRLSTMHLGRRHQFSTLRRSLGSVLARANGQATIDEVALTAWMHEHLRVVAVPLDDPDTLDALETTILRQLDPPLNLSKVPKTALRARLSALRSHYTS